MRASAGVRVPGEPTWPPTRASSAWALSAQSGAPRASKRPSAASSVSRAVPVTAQPPLHDSEREQGSGELEGLGKPRMRVNGFFGSGERSLQVAARVAEQRAAAAGRGERPWPIEPAPTLLELLDEFGRFVESTEPDERFDLVLMKAKGDHGRLSDAGGREVPAKRSEFGFRRCEVAERELEEPRDRPQLELGRKHPGLCGERKAFVDDLSRGIDASSMRRDERLGGQGERALRILDVPERRGDRLVDEAIGTWPVALGPCEPALEIENVADRAFVARLRGAAVQRGQLRPGGVELACPDVEHGEHPARLTDDPETRALALERERSIEKR